MRAVIQRVAHSRVQVDGDTVGEIDGGLLVLVGVAHDDTQTAVDLLAEKITGLRIFADDQGRMNRSILDVAGEIIVVSQFTLLADCRKGRRPSFTKAAHPDRARDLYRALTDAFRKRGISVATGRFGAEMSVTLTNDGPVTLILDTADYRARSLS